MNKWISIKDQLPPKGDYGVLALYLPFIDGQRVHDITQAQDWLDSDMVILWWLRDHWFVGQKPQYKFTEENIKDSIGWWSPIPGIEEKDE